MCKQVFPVSLWNFSGHRHFLSQGTCFNAVHPKIKVVRHQNAIHTTVRQHYKRYTNNSLSIKIKTGNLSIEIF